MFTSWHSRLAAFLLLILPTALMAQPGGAVSKLEVRPWAGPVLLGQTDGGFACETPAGILFMGGTTGGKEGTSPAWFLPRGADRWESSTVLVPKWTAGAAWSEGMVCAGGLVDGQPTARVQFIGVRDGRANATDLTPLPVALAGASAAVIDGTLYVFGGASSLRPPKVENALWTLALAKPGATWQRGAALPAAGRFLCAATSQYGSLCIFGGMTLGGQGTNEKLQVSAQTWMYRPVPLEATSVTGWQRMADLPSPLADARAASLGQAHVLLLGGQREASVGPFDPPVDAPAAPDRPVLFDVITNAWSTCDRTVDVRSPLPIKTSSGALLALGQVVDDVGTNPIAGYTVSIPRNVRSLAWADYVVICGYFLLIAFIGFWFSRGQESSEEFSLGNRRVPWWAAGISMFATGASAITFMAVPALAFRTNFVWLLPLSMLIPAYFINAYYIFPLLRRLDITSTYEYLERRFNVPLRLIASAQCVLLQTFGRASIVLVLPALAISAVTGINVYASVIGMGVVTTIYTSLGGFQAVVWTEVFQGVLKFLAPLLMIGFCLASLPGGLHEFVHSGLINHKFEFALPTWNATVPAVWILLVSFLLQFTIYQAGDQPIIQRVFSSPAEEVRRVSAMSAACGLLIGAVANLLGIAIFCYFRAHPDKFDPGSQTDQIVPLFTIQAMPVGFAGLVIAAIFASAMSTVASAMNSVATIFTEDFFLKLRPGATDRQRLVTLKATSYVVGFIATGIALYLATLRLDSILVVWNQISALLGGGIVGVYSLGMFTRRANGFGAVGGAVISVVLTAMLKLFTPLHWATYLPAAILSCMLGGYLLSLCSRQQKDLRGLTVWTDQPEQDRSGRVPVRDDHGVTVTPGRPPKETTNT